MDFLFTKATAVAHQITLGFKVHSVQILDITEVCAVEELRFGFILVFSRNV